MKARGEGDDRGQDGWTVSSEATNMNLTQLQEAVEDKRAWNALVHGVMRSRTGLNNNNTNLHFSASLGWLGIDSPWIQGSSCNAMTVSCWRCIGIAAQLNVQIGVLGFLVASLS